MRARSRAVLLPLLLALGLAAGCTVGPNYQRPRVAMPSAYRGAQAPEAKTSAAPGKNAPSGTASLGNQKWWTVFRDPVLQRLIRTALRQNYDVRIAAQRVLETQAQLGITRSNQYPIVDAGANLFAEHNPKAATVLPAYRENAGSLDVSVLWNLDFWGKYRRETEAARDEMLATEWGQRAVETSVVSSVATAYFQLREDDLALSIARQTLGSRQSSLHLTQVLYKNGGGSMLDVSQAQELVFGAQSVITGLERQIAQQENLIRDLLGEDPGPVTRGLALTAEPLPAEVPAGLPSELLDRRPDIRAAEAHLMAANADIGVAKAAFFPNIALTATGGFESYALNRFFSAPSALWNVTGSLVQHIFQAGALRAGVQLTQAQKTEMVLAYRQSISDALRQVSDGLVAYQRDRELEQQQAQLTAAAKQADQLSEILFQHGGASFLQVLTSETNYFSAELDLAQAQLNERLALVELYNALGGGWQ